MSEQKAEWRGIMSIVTRKIHETPWKRIREQSLRVKYLYSRSPSGGFAGAEMAIPDMVIKQGSLRQTRLLITAKRRNAIKSINRLIEEERKNGWTQVCNKRGGR